MGAFNWLDLAPDGRNDGDGTMAWLRLHDEYRGVDAANPLQRMKSAGCRSIVPARRISRLAKASPLTSPETIVVPPAYS